QGLRQSRHRAGSSTSRRRPRTGRSGTGKENGTVQRSIAARTARRMRGSLEAKIGCVSIPARPSDTVTNKAMGGPPVRAAALSAAPLSMEGKCVYKSALFAKKTGGISRGYGEENGTKSFTNSAAFVGA